jgi:hypothetical protein
MDSYQANWVSCILPILIIYAFVEINRGWRVLRYGELSLSPNQRMFVGLVRLLRGGESADRAHEYSINNGSDMKFYGWLSLVGGILILIVCFIWVVAVF